MSPFTSLPEIRSFNEQNSSDNSNKINNKIKQPPVPATSSWEKSSSWSWKSNDARQLSSIKNERAKPSITNKEIQHQVSHYIYLKSYTFL
jgi:hypothetical protein